MNLTTLLLIGAVAWYFLKGSSASSPSTPGQYYWFNPTTSQVGLATQAISPGSPWVVATTAQVTTYLASGQPLVPLTAPNQTLQMLLNDAQTMVPGLVNLIGQL